MKKVTSIILMVAMFLGIFGAVTSSSALNDYQLQQYRKQMQQKLDATPWVSWYDLTSNPDGYKGSIVKMQGTVVGIDETSALLQDSDGNYFCIQRISYYQLKYQTNYIISGNFIGIKKNARVNDGTATLVYIAVEDAHVPFMSEYSGGFY